MAKVQKGLFTMSIWYVVVGRCLKLGLALTFCYLSVRAVRNYKLFLPSENISANLIGFFRCYKVGLHGGRHHYTPRIKCSGVIVPGHSGSIYFNATQCVQLLDNALTKLTTTFICDRCAPEGILCYTFVDGTHPNAPRDHCLDQSVKKGWGSVASRSLETPSLCSTDIVERFASNPARFATFSSEK